MSAKRLIAADKTMQRIFVVYPERKDSLASFIKPVVEKKMGLLELLLQIV